MLIKRPADIKYSEVTAENLYHNRREFLRTATATLGIAAAGTILPGCVNAASSEPARADSRSEVHRLQDAVRSEATARRAGSWTAELALHRRPPDGRSDESAGTDGNRNLRQATAESGRRTVASGHAMEVRLQRREVD